MKQLLKRILPESFVKSMQQKRAFKRRTKELNKFNRLKNKLVFFGQGLEDKIIRKILGDKKNGFYIDIGAHSPIGLNNTCHFYLQGWRGINVEPNIDLIEKFKIFRPEDTILNVAVSNFEGEADFFIGKHSVHSSLKNSDNRMKGKVKVKVTTLEKIVKENKVGQIDFISIDTEGTEIDVLKGLNLDKNRPRLIMVEYNTAGIVNEELEPYLISKGYQVIFINAWNMIFSKEYKKDFITVYK